MGLVLARSPELNSAERPRSIIQSPKSAAEEAEQILSHRNRREIRMKRSKSAIRKPKKQDD